VETESPGVGRSPRLFALLVLGFCLIGLLIGYQAYRMKEMETRLHGMEGLYARSVRGIEEAPDDPPPGKPGGGDIEGEQAEDRPLPMPDVTINREEERGDPCRDADFRIYNALETDTLWGIAERAFGEGKYYPVLLECNPHLGIYTIGDGVQVKILEDRRLAEEIYGTVLVRKEGRKYWYYTVADGDSLQTIADRFYRGEDRIEKIVTLNPAARFQPGEKIRLVLE